MKFKRGINIKLNNEQKITVPQGEIWKINMNCWKDSSNNFDPRYCTINGETVLANAGPYIISQGAELGRSGGSVTVFGVAFTAD